MKMLAKITVPNFLTRVKMTKGRRATYYTQKTPLPKKYQGNEFHFDAKGRLCTQDGQPLVKNVKSLNTPRYKTINGQEFYAGVAHPAIRAKIVGAIKDSFRPYLYKVRKIKEFPIKMHCAYYAEPGIANWDLDNKWIYTKVFQDLLVSEGIIPEDNIKYISSSAAIEFFPIAEGEESKLVFIITKDERKHSVFYHDQ